MSSRFVRVITSPWLYASWALVAVSALVGTYLAELFTFGITTLVTMWITAVTTPAGLGASLFAPGRSRAERAWTAVAALVPAVAVIASILVLSRINWA
jgi:hypothetical protein